MFREQTARATLDALGLTGLSDFKEHNIAVRDARAWFQAEAPEVTNEVTINTFFECAGIILADIRPHVLAIDVPMRKPLTRKPKRRKKNVRHN